MITLVMPTTDKDKAQKTLKALEGTSGVDFVPVVVYDGQGVGYTRTVNRGLRAAEGKVVIVNDDIRLSENWLAVLDTEVEKRQALGVLFAGPSGNCRTPPQNSGRKGDCRRPRVVKHLAGFCLYVRDVEEAGLLDEDFIHYASEVDWQWRNRGRSLWVPSVWCEHELHDPIAKWWRHDQGLLQQRHA